MNRNTITLDEIQPFDLFGMRPNTWWEKETCKLMNSWTFHWGVFVRPIAVPGLFPPQITDYIVSESIGTGVDLTRLAGRPALVWRVNHTRLIDCCQLINIHSEYGNLPYGWEVNFRTAVWWIAKQYFGRILPVDRKGPPNCVSWVDVVAGLLGYQLVPEDQYPMPANLEASPLLQYIGEVNSEL